MDSIITQTPKIASFYYKAITKIALAIFIISCGQNLKTDTENEENEDIDTKLAKGGHNNNRSSNTPSKENAINIKTLDPKKIAIYKKELAKLYEHTVETLPLIKVPKSEKGKTEFVNRAINFKIIKDTLSNFGYKFDKIKNKGTKQLLKDYEILGIAGIGPSLSKERPENIENHNLTLINSDEEKNDKKDWIINFNNVTKPFLKQAKVWESYNIIRGYNSFDKIPILSSCENHNAQRYSKLDKDFGKCITFFIPISPSIEIEKPTLNSSQYKILQVDAKNRGIAKSKAKFVYDTINIYNRICKKNFKIDQFRYHEGQLYCIALENTNNITYESINKAPNEEKSYHNFRNDFKNDEYNLIPNKNKSLLEVIAKFELLNNTSKTEYYILTKLGLINTKNIFEVDMPKSLKVIKPFSWFIKNESNTIEKKYNKGDVLDRTLAYNIAKTSLCILQELFPTEIQKAVQSCMPNYSAGESLKTKSGADKPTNSKVVLTTEIISKIGDNIEKRFSSNPKSNLSDNLSFYKVLLRAIKPLAINTDKDHTSQDSRKDVQPDSKETLTLKTYGDLWGLFGCFYNSPNEIMEDLLKFKIQGE